MASNISEYRSMSKVKVQSSSSTVQAYTIYFSRVLVRAKMRSTKLNHLTPEAQARIKEEDQTDCQ